MTGAIAQKDSNFESRAWALEKGDLEDPGLLLGPHRQKQGTLLRSFQPGALRVEVLDSQGQLLTEMEPVFRGSGLWQASSSQDLCAPDRYRLRIHWQEAVQEAYDPYSFASLLGEIDLYLLGEGKHYQLNRILGAHYLTVQGIAGTRFAVWAPNARRVSVVAEFNQWDGRRHPMRPRGSSGIWELFIPDVDPGTLYKYEILGRHGLLPLKADPVAWQAEAPPGTASVVAEPRIIEWQDEHWMEQRSHRHSHHAPISIYELHALSWRRKAEEDWRPLNWDELGDELIPYVQRLGFTHIELLPVTAHPFGGSWGYQPIGLFAPYAQAGKPQDFARFVQRCHEGGIGVLIDWVPAHFPNDPHGLMRFDGSALYEHEDEREGMHQDWNTLIYNLGRNEVHAYLIASALHWLEVYHVDGLRVDAVASMLYRDYSRSEGQWVPNRYGGRENLEAIDFLRHLNQVVAERCPGALVIAEESTAWPGVSHPVNEGGLGFAFKWNMGWMHDSLTYISQDPVHRSWHHDKINFGLHYAFSERFVLPLSHDEVVHGKGSMLGKMPGDRWQQFANLRAYYGFMWSHPGKKLLFMGGELAQPSEWNHDSQVDWEVLNDPMHRGVQQLIADLNDLYCGEEALHSADTDEKGFCWLVGDDRHNSVYAYYRQGTDESAPPVLVVCNFTPVPHQDYRIGVPRLGYWREIINTDSARYAGSDVHNAGGLEAEHRPSHGQVFSVSATLPPLATMLFVFDDRLTRETQDHGRDNLNSAAAKRGRDGED